MKLATALTERSDLQRRIAEIAGRLTNNARVQEGDSPAEEPEALLRELDAYSKELREVNERIQERNWTTEL